MTRETKVGMAVATTFLCLVSLVVASKLRRPDAAAEGFTEVRPEHASTDPTRLPGEESEPPVETPRVPAPSTKRTEQAPVVPSQNVNVPPAVGVPTTGDPSFAKVDPIPTPLAPATPNVVPGGFERQSEPGGLIPAIPKPADVEKTPNQIAQASNPPPPVAPTPGSEKVDTPGPLPAPSIGPAPAVAPAGLPAPVPISEPKLPGNGAPGSLLERKPMQAGDLTKVPGASSVMPPAMPAAPPLDPLLNPVAAPVAPPVPAPTPMPVDPPVSITPPVPAPGDAVKKDAGNPLAVPPIVAPPGGVDLPKTEPRPPAPGPIPAALTESKNESVKISAAEVKAPLQGGPDPKVAGPPPLVPGEAVPPVPRAGKSASIGTIGTIGTPADKVPVTAPVTPPARGNPVPASGTGKPIPAIATAGQSTPRVKNYADERYVVGPQDTSFEQLSQKLYNSPKYAQALLAYNRQHILATGNLQHDPPQLQANQAIYYPHANILEIEYGRFIQAASTVVPSIGPPPASAPQSAPTVKISTPTPLLGPTSAPLGNPPTSDATVSYRVPQTQWVLDIAQQTLGDGRLWTEILRLNPALRTEQPIPAGTELRLPATAKLR